MPLQIRRGPSGSLPASPAEGEPLYNTTTQELLVGTGAGSVAMAKKVHTHAVADVTGLQTALDGKVATINSVAPTAGNVVINLDALSDVTIAAATNGQFLKYNGSQWVNAAFDQTTPNLNGLSDVQIGGTLNGQLNTLADGQVLKYNAQAQQWVNGSGIFGSGLAPSDIILSAASRLVGSPDDDTTGTSIALASQLAIANVSGTETLDVVLAASSGLEKSSGLKIADGGVTTAKLANASVTVAKISATGTANNTTFLRGDGSWASAYLGTGGLTDGTKGEINVASSGTVWSIVDNAVTSGKIASAAVTTAKLADANVTAAKLASNSVETAKIAASAVTTAKIADANVTAAKLATDSVETAKIADGAVTMAKIAQAGATSGQVIKWNGTAWAPGTDNSSSGSGSVSGDTIWDAAGDLAVGDGPDAAVRLARGSAGQVLTVNSAGTNIEWKTPGGGGTKTLHKWTAMDNQPPDTAFATLDTRNSIAVLDFDHTTEESAVFVGMVPEGTTFASGSSNAVTVRLFWTTAATTGNVRWGAQFDKLATNEALGAGAYDTAVEATTAVGGTDGHPVFTELTFTGNDIGDTLAAGDVFRLKVYRDVADTADTVNSNDAELIAVEMRLA